MAAVSNAEVNRVEAMGKLLVSLHQDLQDISHSLNHNSSSAPEAAFLKGRLDRAQDVLRQQAHELYAIGSLALNKSRPGPEVNPHRPPLGASGGSRGASNGLPPPPPGSARPHSGQAYPPAPRSRPPWHQMPPHIAAAMQTGGSGRSNSMEAPREQTLRPLRRRSKTTTPLRRLPKINRLDPLLDPPHLTEEDMQTGLLSLSDRGFIPHSADLTPAMERGMPVIMHRPAPMYDQALKHERREIALADGFPAAKLDERITWPPPRLPNERSVDELLPQLSSGFASSTWSAKSGRQLVPLAANRLPAPIADEAQVTLLALPAPPVAAALFQSPHHRTVGESYTTFCTELLENAGDMPEQITLPWEQPVLPDWRRAEMERDHAATKISALWRCHQEYRRCQEKLRRVRAAKKIQRAWFTSLTRVATKAELVRRQDEERKLHTLLMFHLAQDWFQIKQKRRVEIHVCSLSFAEHRRQRMEGYQALQAAQIARIFRLMDSKRDIIFVAPKPVHDDILDYYSKIMQFRGVQNPPGRFQVVVPENMGLTPTISLSQALLCSPKALRRIHRLVSGRREECYIVPEAVTYRELKLATTLQLPMLGPTPKNFALLSSKSHGKELAKLAELPIGPWAVDIYDEDEFFTSLAGLVVRYPQYRTWLFKIDDERDSRGHAYIDLDKFQEVAAQARSLAGGHSRHDGPEVEGDEEPALIGADAAEVRELLQRQVPRKAVVCSRRVYPDFSAWLFEACRVGAIIQAVPNVLISQTSVHLQVEPTGHPKILGTTEAVMSQPFVRAASWVPHTKGSWEVLEETGKRMGRVLAAKGFVGFASVDVVFFENPDFDPAKLEEAEREPTPAVIGCDTPLDSRQQLFGHLRSPSPAMTEGSRSKERPHSGRVLSLPESRQADYELALQLQAMAPGKPRAQNVVEMMLGTPSAVGALPASPYGCWVVDVDARLTDEAAALFPLQFIAQVQLDQSTGMLRLSPEAPNEAEPMQRLTEEERFEKSQRWALVSHVAMLPGLEKMSYQSLFQAAKMKGVSFDLFHNCGSAFVYLDVFNSLFSLLTVDRSEESCARRASEALAKLLEGIQKGPSGSRHMNTKVMAPRDAPVAPGREDEASDSLSIADVQIAVRTALRQFADKSKNSVHRGS